MYEATVVANDQYISYTQTFEISVEFPANFDFTVSPQAPVANDRTTGKRTFVLALTLLEIKATSPMFVVDWGDGSDIAPAAPLLKKCFDKHVYAQSGIYKISVTGFNQVSTKTINRTVRCLTAVLLLLLFASFAAEMKTLNLYQ
jgi:hypothetical protein